MHLQKQTNKQIHLLNRSQQAKILQPFSIRNLEVRITFQSSVNDLDIAQLFSQVMLKFGLRWSSSLIG